jgi:hypothetical protein
MVEAKINNTETSEIEKQRLLRQLESNERRI